MGVNYFSARVAEVVFRSGSTNVLTTRYPAGSTAIFSGGQEFELPSYSLILSGIDDVEFDSVEVNFLISLHMSKSDAISGLASMLQGTTPTTGERSINYDLQLLNTKIALSQPSVQSGVPTVAATAPTNPQIGDTWFDNVNLVLKVYDGLVWRAVIGDIRQYDTTQEQQLELLMERLRLDRTTVLRCIWVAVADYNVYIAGRSPNNYPALDASTEDTSIQEFFDDTRGIIEQRLLDAYFYIATLLDKSAEEYHQAFQLGNFDNTGRFEAIDEGVRCLEMQLKRAKYRAGVQ